MFNSTILDVAVGLIFVFLAVSLVASTVLEAISSALKWRSKSLKAGIGQLLNDPDFTQLAGALYAHAAINPLTVSTARVGAPAPAADPAPRPRSPAAKVAAAWADRRSLGRRAAAALGFGSARWDPAYIAKDQFAAVLLQVLGLSGAAAPGSPGAGQQVQAMLDALSKSDLLKNEQLAEFFDGVVRRSRGDLDAVRAAVADWFDNGMDRLSGAYKRRTQLVSFAIALLVAVVLNVDTIRITRALWEQPTLVDNLKIPPDVAASPAARGTSADDPPGPGLEQAQLSADALAARQALAVLDANLPVGWPAGFGHLPKGATFAAALLGWLITAFSALFGAPFWFDTLQAVVRLKGAGPSPSEKREGRAAAA